MYKNITRKHQRKKYIKYDFEIEQDDNFSLIVGYTSSGFPFGNPWEETDDKLADIEDVFI